ncbi:perlucin-like [Ochlerotatus camptorhynchus]|uniref:perlucin-like n=1 Tax=Ochlerotatus camptorhynchus TaxID=644619 RepID=UPI0031D9E907
MQKVILIVLSIAVLYSSGQQVKCVLNSKYFIPNFTANWYKASEYCSYVGMRLAIVPDADAQSKVVEMIKSTDKFNNVTTEIWIGASDLAQESFFHWHATGHRVQYTNWKDKQPDNAGKVEHCVEVRYIPTHGWNWHWNDRECTVARYFICENLELGKEIAQF